jgi:O-antigen/teichoic acid export membrane protein
MSPDEPEEPGVREPSVVRNASSSYLYRFAYGVVVLLLTPYLFRELGTGGFGTYSVILTFATVFNLLEVAFSNGIAKLAAELIGRGERRQLRDLLGTAVALAAGLGLLAAALTIAIGLAATGLAASGDKDAFTAGMAALALMVIVRMPCMVYAATLIGHQRYDLLNTVRLIGAVAYGAGTVAAVAAGGGLVGAALALAGSMLLESLLYLVYMKRMDRELPVGPDFGDRESRRRIASFSSYLLIADAAIFVGHRFQPVIIAALRNAATAAPFAAAVKLQTGVQSAVYPFVDLLIPMVSELEGRGRREEVLDRLGLATRAALQITLPLALGFALFADDVVDVWLGSDAPGVTAEIVVILMLVQIVTLTATPATMVLIGLGRVRLTAGLAAFEGVANLVLTVVLVSAHGAIGAAIPMLMTSLLVAPWMPWFACRTAGGSPLALVRESLWPAVASSLPGIAAMVLVWVALDASAARLLLGMALGLGISAAVALAQVGPQRLRAIFAELRLGRRPALSEPA